MQKLAECPSWAQALIITVIDLQRSIERMQRRRPLNDMTKRKHIENISEFYHDHCPCCSAVKVVERGQRGERGVFDHWTDNPAKNRPEDTWLICDDCNSGFQAGTMARVDYQTEFMLFQKKRGELWDRQRALGLPTGPIPLPLRKEAA